MTGNLGKDPEVRYSTGAQQQAVCRFPIAINDGYKGKQTTTWVNVVSFGKTAENCEKFLAKGRKVLVDGRLQIREYEKQDGGKGISIDVVANSIEFLNNQNEQQQTQQWQPAQQPQWTPTQARREPQQQAMPGFMQVDEDVPF